MKYILLASLSFASYFFGFTSFAQQIIERKSVNKELINKVAFDFQAHPEFNQYQLDIPVENIELIQLRTENSKTFYGVDDQYRVQQTGGTFHFKDINSNWISIQNEASKHNSSFGIHQSELPITVNTQNGLTEMVLSKNGEIFQFGQHAKLEYVNKNGLVAAYEVSDFNHHEVSGNDLLMKNVFQGIDRIQSINYWDIRTDFIIQNKLELSNDIKNIQFTDQLKLPENWKIEYHEGEMTKWGWQGSLRIMDQNNHLVSTISIPKYYDSSVKKDNKDIGHALIGTYLLEKQSDHYVLKMIIPTEWLNQSNLVYPLIFDPTATNTYANNQAVNDYNAMFTTSCQATMTVSGFPATGTYQVTGTNTTYRIWAKGFIGSSLWAFTDVYADKQEQRSRVGSINGYTATQNGSGILANGSGFTYTSANNGQTYTLNNQTIANGCYTNQPTINYTWQGYQTFLPYTAASDVPAALISGCITNYQELVTNTWVVTTTYNVTSGSTPTFNQVGPICSGASFTLPTTSTNSITGTWSPANNNTTTTTYTFTPNLGQCATTTTMTVTVNSTTTPTISSVPASCTSDELSSISNYSATNTYTFSPVGPTVAANGDINGMTTGTNYTVTATSNGCTSTASVSFSNDPQAASLPAPTINSTPANCNANEISTISNYNASNTYTFTPTGPTVAANGDVNGMTIGTSYTVVASSGGCTSPASASFSNDPQLSSVPTPTISSTPATCTADGTSNMTNYSATNTYTFTPTGPTVAANGDINGMTLGTSYTVTASSGGCTSPASNSFVNDAQLSSLPTPTIVSTPASCTSDEISTISNYLASSSYTFTPSGPTVGANGVVNNMTIGTSYTVIASNGPCVSNPSTAFDNSAMMQMPDVNAVGNNTICSNESINVVLSSSQAGTTFSWEANTSNINGASNGSGNSIQHTLSSENGGTVNYVITPTLGTCVGTPITFTVSILNVIAAFNPSSNSISEMSSAINFNNNSFGATSYSWDFGDGSISTEENPSHTFNFATDSTYQITLIAQNSIGCSDTATTSIGLVEELIFWIPNTFTPDGDMYNNAFEPVFTSGIDKYDFVMYIFNRWGETIFETHDTEFGWDGSYKGRMSPTGTYVWKIEFKMKVNDERKVYQGHVNLIK